MFTAADVAWPPILKAIFRFLSFFNLDMDVAAPECLVPDFDYRIKFFTSSCQCLLRAGMRILGHIIFWVFLNRGREIPTLFKLVGTFMSSVLHVSHDNAGALDVYRSMDPDDGWTYTEFTSVDCDVWLLGDPNPYLCSYCRMQLWHLVTPLAIRFGFICPRCGKRRPH